ncbi:MAG: hypothetical protein JWQ40_20 [Segetibacter sp.]|nr:hypothetical protein [Segetibacter sp.]
MLTELEGYVSAKIQPVTDKEKMTIRSTPTKKAYLSGVLILPANAHLPVTGKVIGI